MERVAIVLGSQGHAKNTILDYCFRSFEEKELWLIDSLQVFDPYYLSRINAVRTRQLLHSMQVSRPFTFHQLHDRIVGLSWLSLTEKSAVIISSLDCFHEDIEDYRERTALYNRMLRALARTRENTGCMFIIGVQQQKTAEDITAFFGGAELWEEQSGL